jgi:hypothetical protein
MKRVPLDERAAASLRPPKKLLTERDMAAAMIRDIVRVHLTTEINEGMTNREWQDKLDSISDAIMHGLADNMGWAPWHKIKRPLKTNSPLVDQEKAHALWKADILNDQKIGKHTECGP